MISDTGRIGKIREAMEGEGKRGLPPNPTSKGGCSEAVRMSSRGREGRRKRWWTGRHSDPGTFSAP